MDFSLAAVITASSYFGREVIMRVRELSGETSEDGKADWSNVLPFVGALGLALAITLGVAEVPASWAGFVVTWAVMAGLHEGLGAVNAWRKRNGG